MLYPYFDAQKIEAGCDEAGRGCLAGPVTAAAVILPKDFEHPLLNDSKKMSGTKRNQLRVVIEKEAISYAVAHVSQHEIDEINILQASFLAMHRAIAQLQETPELLLIDGNRFKPYNGIDFECIIKGDGKYTAIAAASVLAKTYRDELMVNADAEYPMYGWKQNAGYPTIQHRAAIAKHGVTNWHRKSFKLLADEQLNLFENEN